MVFTSKEIHSDKRYLIKYGNDWPWKYAELDGKDVIPLCERIDKDREVHEVWIYECSQIPLDAKIEDTHDVQYCITFWFESQRHPPNAWQSYNLMIGHFVQISLKRYLHEPGASNVRLLKVDLFHHESISWFFRDFARIVETKQL